MFQRNLSRRSCLALFIAGAMAFAGVARADDVLKPGTERPKDAVILFDGSNTDAWNSTDWPVKDNVLTASKHDILTKEKFGDYQLHLEFNEPQLGPEFKGQDRGNSGVYQQGRYELQVLDSYKNDTYADGACGAVYGIKPPAKNMAKPPGEWQTYDITFHAAKFEDGKKVKNAFITVYWNGELVQDNTEIPHITGGGAPETAEGGPLRLQYHNHAVQFRNIWILPTGDKK